MACCCLRRASAVASGIPAANHRQALRRAVTVGSTCRICLDAEPVEDLFSPCMCAGTMKYIHRGCLQTWRSSSSNQRSYYRCEQCHYEYNVRRMDAAGILAWRGFPQLATVCVLLASISLFTFASQVILPREDPILWFVLGCLTFGICAFFAILCCSADRTQLCHEVCQMIGLIRYDESSGLAQFIAGLCVVAIAAMVWGGLVHGPRLIYGQILRVTRSSIGALETFVLDVRDVAGPEVPFQSSSDNVGGNDDERGDRGLGIDNAASQVVGQEVVGDGGANYASALDIGEADNPQARNSGLRRVLTPDPARTVRQRTHH